MSLVVISFCRTSYSMGEFYQLYLSMLLLMRAGDIETNPGPITPESDISELEILLLSKEINPAYYHSLGTSLGINMKQLHHVNPDAFLSVLMEWNADQQPPDINKRELLADNLQRIGLDDLSDKIRSGSLIQKSPYTPADPTESPVEPMSPELIERCRKDFMLKYKTTLCRIRADPLNPDSLVQLQEIYTNLVLEEEDGKGNRNLKYDDLLNLKGNGRTLKRLLIQGEAGAGKTTLCAKIAWDWINGTHYQQFAWLLIVPLRESGNYTMGDIAKSYLQEGNPTTASQLTHYICSNPDNVLTVYDGLDEFKGKLQKERRSEPNDDALTQMTRQQRPTRPAGDDTRQEYTRPLRSHTQEPSVYSHTDHADGFNKESGAQQTSEKTKQEKDERQKLGEVAQHRSGFSKDTGGDFTQVPDNYTEQPEGSEASRQPKGFLEAQGIHSHRQVGLSALQGSSIAHSGLHTRNPFGNTQHHDPKYNCELVIEDIICCNQLNTSIVLITTRPWKARDIRGVADIRKAYAFIRVDGFTKENMSTYIHKYFAQDESRASDLIEFIKESDVLSESMARYPIFVAMLCLMWKEIKVERKQAIKSLQTYSQFFGEMFMFLKEHYVQKITDDLGPSSLDRLINETSVLLKPIAKLAFTGLLKNTLIFDERHFQDCKDSKTAACRVGILSQENRIAPMVGREEQKSHAQSTVFFPHKLFQEFMAGVHLASLHDSDDKEYTKLMKEVVLPRKEDFRYLLYFTASQNKTVGISVLTHMVQGSKERTGFLADVTFESNDQDAVAVVQRNTTPKMETLEIDYSLTSHTIAGYASVGVDVVNLCIVRVCGKTVSRDVGKIICSSPSLEALTIQLRMHDDFYAFLAKEGPKIKVTTLCLDHRYDKLSSSASRDLAEALCSMPHLNDLTLINTSAHKDFCRVIEERASRAKRCFPQVAEGQFRFNGEIQRDIPSLLNSLRKILFLCLEETGSSWEVAEAEEEGCVELDDYEKKKNSHFSNEAGKESNASHEGDGVDDPEDHEGRNPEQSEEKSDDFRDDDKSAEYMKDSKHVGGFFDHQGGELSLEAHGCTLRIPPGALDEESRTEITLEVLTELPDDIELEEDEMIVSPGFKCLPSGLHFKKPVKLIMPHCAVLNNPGKVKTVLHSWSHQTGKVERIIQTSQTCQVHRNHFELTLEHFCRRYLTMFWDWLFVRGKLMCYMPYLPNKMPLDRKPHVQLRLENKPKLPITYTKGPLYQPALDKAEEIMIERNDLTVNCEHDDKTQTKIIERSRLFNTTSCTAFFKLDLQDKDENTSHASVTLKLTQTITQEAMFDTGCIAPSEASRLHKDAFPEQECATSEVSDKEFLTLTKSIKSSRYLEVGITLGIDHALLEDIRERCRSNQDALMDVFMKWRVKQPPDTDIRSSLADKLEEVGLQELSGKLRNGTL